MHPSTTAGVEPMAPTDVEGADAMPVGRFYKRFGAHLHSVAWYIEGLGDLYDALDAHGVRMFADGGVPITERPSDGAIYTQHHNRWCVLGGGAFTATVGMVVAQPCTIATGRLA